MGRKTVTLVPVNVWIGREQVPQIVIVPQRKRQHMIHIEGSAKGLARPDTFLRIKVPVSVPGVVDVTLEYGRAQQSIDNLAQADCLPGNLSC
jgi:hypothetical protein